MNSYNKYRPNDFNEMIGNRSVIESLQSIFNGIEYPHAYLFTGPSGCGKTTIARIIAKKYLKCSDMDFSEVNSSNNRGIDTARDIIAGMKFKAIQGNVRVYLLDEFHRTTKDFQNAILKALEDTPPHVYFILCTTEPEKIISTIRNRCTTFQVHHLNPIRMKKLIISISKKDKIKLSEDVVKKIIQEVEGSPRKALVTYDQIKNMEDEDEQLKAISSIRFDEKNVIDLCRALLDKSTKWEKVTGIIKAIETEPESVRRAVLGYFTNVLLSKMNGRAALILECFEDNYYDSGKAGLLLSCYKAFNFD